MPVIHPAFGVPTRVRVERLPDSNAGSTARTIDRMRSFAVADASDPAIAGLARQLGGGSLGGREYADRVHAWLRNNVRFVQDRDLAAPLAGFLDSDDVAEVLIRPAELVRMPDPQGDCDDFSMLTLALLRAGGVPASFATVAANPRSPDDYSHVYVVAHLAEGDLPVDSSHGPYSGWEVPNAFQKFREWEVGLGGLGCACDQNIGMGFVSTSPAAGSGTPDWLSALINSGTQIAQTVLQKPVYQSTPAGTTIYQGQVPTIAPTGSAAVAANIIPGVSNTTLLLGAAALILAISVMGRRK